MQYRAMSSWISHQKSHKRSPQDVYGASTDPKTSQLASVYEQYEGRLRQANALDFDDLLLETVRLLAHDADLRFQMNRRFEFVMIDEYQDTNRSQYELMRLLTEAHKNICVVGDEDQSIYGWRGADIRNILDFEHDYPNAARHPPGTELPLDEEHSRSRQRRGRAQHRAQGKVALDRIRRGLAARPLRGFRRRTGSAVHRRRHRAAAGGESRRPRRRAVPHQLPVAPD